MVLGVIGNYLSYIKFLIKSRIIAFNFKIFRHGRRKPCMLIPILGELMTALGLMLCTYFENAPMEVAGVTEALFPGLTGKQ